MTLEQNVLSALGQVKKYKKLGKENIALCGSSNRPIIVLQKKAPTVKLSDLSGKWMISEAGARPFPKVWRSNRSLNLIFQRREYTVMPVVILLTVDLLQIMRIPLLSLSRSLSVR